MNTSIERKYCLGSFFWNIIYVVHITIMSLKFLSVGGCAFLAVIPSANPRVGTVSQASCSPSPHLVGSTVLCCVNSVHKPSHRHSFNHPGLVSPLPCYLGTLTLTIFLLSPVSVIILGSLSVFIEDLFNAFIERSPESEN